MKIGFSVQRPMTVYGGVIYVMVHLREVMVTVIVEMDQMNYIVMVSVLKSCHLSNQY